MIVAQADIRGHCPRPTVTAGEVPWREAISATLAQQGVQPVSVDLEAFLQVQVTFYLPPNRWGDADLDNLSKPVLDTLFLGSRKFAHLSGKLCLCDDAKIQTLVLKKVPESDPARQGIAVIVSLSPEGAVGP